MPTENSNIKVALTGASGHIGNCLVRDLLAQNYQVKVLVRNSSTGLENSKLTKVNGDILKPQSLNELCKQVDIVFHLAAHISIDNSNPELTQKINIQGTKNILEAANSAGVKKFIHLSSIDAIQIGKTNLSIDENSPLVNSQKVMYDYSKAESERMVLNATKNGFKTIVLSPTAVIGPHDYKNSYLGQAIRKIYTGKLPFIVSGGYNWVDVRDVSNACIKAIKYGLSGEKYIVSGHYAGLNQLAATVANLANKPKPITLPILFAKIGVPFIAIYARLKKQAPLYTNHSLYLLQYSPKKINSSKINKDLKYTPRSFEETIEDTVNWYKQNKLLDGY